MITQIHQLLHGYRRGHELLAGSIKLSSQDEEVLTRLSDLSGSLTTDAEFYPYITAFPVPSRRFYALARTWVDKTAPRAGCVVTHTLLIASPDWQAILDPHGLSSLFREPQAAKHLSDYSAPISYKPVDGGLLPLRPPGEAAAREFVAKFFGQGMRPLVWFDEPNAEESLWLILRRLWPGLRKEFACCTFSLQPRALEDRLFDLMFAPSSAYRRFLAIPRENLLGISPAQVADGPPSVSEPWFAEWAAWLFGQPRYEDTNPADLSQMLDSDPTSIKNLFLMRELRRRIPVSPTAAIGLMDLVATLAPEAAAAEAMKKDAVELALRATSTIADTKEALNCYFLISERLGRSPFKTLSEVFDEDMRASVALKTLEDPGSALAVGDRMLASHDALRQSAFGSGIVEGLAKTAQIMPERLDILTHAPLVASSAIAERPMIAAQFLRGMASKGRKQEASRFLATWIGTLRHDQEGLRKVRAEILPLVDSDDQAPLLEELLRSMLDDDVNWALETLSRSHVLKFGAIRQVVSEALSAHHPDSVRAWANQTNNWTTGAADLVAQSFTKDIVGFERLLQSSFPDKLARAQTVAAYVDDIGSDQLPWWFKDDLRDNPRALVPLLALGPELPAAVSAALSKALSQVRDIPIARDQSLIHKLDTCAGSPIGPALIDQAMRSAISSFIDGIIDAGGYRDWQNTDWGTKWLLATESGEFRSFIAPRLSNSDAWDRAWAWIAGLPKELFVRNPAVILDLVQSMISPRYPWTRIAARAWVRVLERAAMECDRTAYLRLCANALQFGFAPEHRHLPLSEMIVAAFPPVYVSITDLKDAPPDVTDRFGMFGWDKGKDLRKDLVYAFTHSRWPPGDLALAANDLSLLRKVFKRVMRQYQGGDYVEAMLQDLAKRSDSNAQALFAGLRVMAGDPNFYEGWD